MGKKRNKTTNCLNCNYQFKASENYCPNCGQENHDLKIPFTHLIEELLEGFFHFEGKVFNTLKVLFTRPGKLTKDFVEGKRVAYVPPIRLYIFTSFVFFLALGIQTKYSLSKEEIKQKLNKAADNVNKEEQFLSVEINTPNDSVKVNGNLEKLVQADSANNTSEDVEFDNTMIQNGIKALGEGGRIQAIQKGIKHISLAILVLLPLLALVLWALYFRSKKYFYEYLIFAIHFQVVLYVLLLLALIINYWELPNILYTALFWGAFFYFVISLKTFFNRSWMESSFKAIVVLTVYSLMVTALLIMSSIYTIYTFNE